VSLAQLFDAAKCKGVCPKKNNQCKENTIIYQRTVAKLLFYDASTMQAM
jgi:hypothetical protein